MTTIPFFLSREGSLRRRLLVHYFTQPGSSHYVRELAGLLEADPANLSRDLKQLEEEGLFRSELRGNHKYFHLNTAFPFYSEYRSLIAKLAKPGLVNAAGESSCGPSSRSQAAYIMAGANGAGKTTFAKTFLPDYLKCRTFVNADLIAGGLAPLAPDKAAVRAGKLLLHEIRETARKKADFGFETTLAGKSYLRLFRELSGAGHALHLFFLWIPTAELSLKRIADRVRRGGHHIPEAVARRRFVRGLANLFHLYRPLLSSWTVFDNSGMEPKIIAHEAAGKTEVFDESLFSKIKKQAGVP